MDVLSNLNDMLVARFGPLGPLYVVGLLGLVLILAVLPSMLRKRPEPFDKLKAMRVHVPTKSQSPTLRRGDKSDKLEKFANFLEPQDVETMTASRLKMVRAGYTNKNAVRMFHFAQFSLGISLLLLGLLYTFIMAQKGEVTTQFKLLATLIPGCAGYYLPQYWVQRRLQTRQQQIIQGFPDALDLMLVCVEAGQSLDQSINRMAKARAGSERPVRTHQHLRHLVIRDHAGAIGHLRHLDCRSASGLLG
jgi:tight adherence protein C